ncbi:hypothetical protein Moror_2166 [Moniliophthora roreri MCA 2997]|uniref:Uncharacterized protein n=2 Tax=Moniliophthora roreri TaxID=221103 RepID=V2WT18_MONRO|nr:hypothetical protein Moror_2166 [Moniliophthora roreri MCA 2997]KAI3607802.1 hypothetical protein WG66_004567 [Moniliophthora roreri]
MSTKDVNWTLCFPRSSSSPMVVKSPKPTTIPENHILLNVDRFGFSANNVTYQAFGEHPSLRYYDFFPAPENSEENVSPKTHGVVPVWGFATVVASAHPKVHVGERLYGYFAPTKYLLVPIDPKDINKHAMYVPRPQFPPDRRLYHQILRCATDPLYTPTPEAEDLMMLYRPLFWTSYWCEDWLAHSGYHGGCDAILISSASSKTAFCFAYCARNRAARGGVTANTRLIGLTSKKNMEFTKRLNLYHEVHEYDTFKSAEVFQGGQGKRWIYVDVAGSDDLNSKVFDYFASPYTGRLVTAVSLGMTNVTPESPATSLNADESTFNGIMAGAGGPKGSESDTTSSFWPRLERFFTPEWVEVRRKELPPREIFEMQRTEWQRLMKDCVKWVKIERTYGPKAVKKEYERIAKSGVGPDKGLVWSLWESEKANLEKAKL